MKYLTLYYEWMKEGRLSKKGLCYSIGKNDKYLKLMTPDNAYGFWGEPDKTVDSFPYIYGFNTLRQNIVLFMAAMNNEL